MYDMHLFTEQLVTMKIRFYGLLLLAGLFCTPLSHAQTLQVDLDNAAFAYDGTQSLVEIYLSFDAPSLPFVADGAGYLANLLVETTVRRNTDATLEGTPETPVWADRVEMAFGVADTTGLQSGQYFVQQLRATMPPGEYELEVKFPSDSLSGRSEVALRRDMVVPDFSDDTLVRLSDVTLASGITQTQDRDDQFYKNGLSIRPNANQLFGLGLPRLFYYAEAYNLDQIADGSGEYTAFAYVAEANRPQPIGDLQSRATRTARTPDVLVGSFNLSKLQSGSYFLRLVILNEDNESVAEQSRKFFVFNPQVEREQPTAVEARFEMTAYATMPEDEVETSLKHIAIISTDQERRNARRIEDLDERRRYLMEFWQVRDPNPNTAINEFQDEFYRRLQYADERYTNNRKEGWETDRGRTILKYGLPSAIEPHLYDRGYVPYERWEYNNITGEGQAFFIFADHGGFGEFELLHSSVTGEPKMMDWERELRQ